MGTQVMYHGIVHIWNGDLWLLKSMYRNGSKLKNTKVLIKSFNGMNEKMVKLGEIKPLVKPRKIEIYFKMAVKIATIAASFLA
jgi:hypothetical protein